MKIVLTGIRNLTVLHDEDNRAPDADNDLYEDVKVVCCAVCRTDAKMWEQGHRDLVFPRVLGHEMVVENEKGARFVVWPGKSCGKCRFCMQGRENLCEDMKITGFHTDGGFADRAVLPRTSLIPVSDDLDTHVACFAEPVGCVVNAFEKFSFEPGNRILVIGGGTMGLITGLYARRMGLEPVILEKNAAKAARVAEFVNAAGIECTRQTNESEFPLVINACADFIAFCQAIAKAGKGGQISFFSGITKNENIETNLLNLLHYREVSLTGVYGMTREHMKKALPFMQENAEFLKLLIEKITDPGNLPELMEKVLSGKYLKFVLDFRLAPAQGKNRAQAGHERRTMTMSDFAGSSGIAVGVIKSITPVSDELVASATAKIDEKTKPLGALGRIEDLGVRMSLILNTLEPEIRRKHIFVFAGDHGITEEGVSAYPSEVTAQMVENFLAGGAAINVLCRHYGIDMKVVDMGVKTPIPARQGLVICRAGAGTKNFAIEDAMTQDQVMAALEGGMKVFLDEYEKNPIDIVGLGEMGIGNTSSASAIISTITGISPAEAVGRGTGIDDKGLSHKIEVLEKALAFHCADPGNGLEILRRMGGFEIAGIAGAVLAAASKKTAVVLDGVISTAAGLVAYVINPDIKGYLISGHKSVEQAQKAALDYMNLTPVIDFDMRLGEGTGAAIAIDMADAACKIMSQMASFDEAKIARACLKS